jgi:hypothetical protein
MQNFEKHLTGIWRSLRVFCFSGRVEQHNTANYIELAIDEERRLCLKQSQNRNKTVVLQPDQWSIQEMKKRWYLFLGKKQSFELITVEPETLVMMEIAKGEKIFFAKLTEWYQRIEPVITSVRHIQADAEVKNSTGSNQALS